MVVLDVEIFQIVMPKIFEVLYQPVAAVFSRRWMEIDFVMLLISDIYFVCQTISNKFGVLRFWKVFACIFFRGI